jgi:hypothetical protein
VPVLRVFKVGDAAEKQAFLGKTGDGERAGLKTCSLASVAGRPASDG